MIDRHLSRRMFGGLFPRAWRGLFILCFVIGCLWLISLSSFLILQPWALELTVLLGFNVTVIVVNWVRWFPSSRKPILWMQLITGYLTVIGFIGCCGLLFLFSLFTSEPRTIRNWDLARDTHVELKSGSDFLGECPSLWLRQGSGLLSSGKKLGSCTGSLKVSLPTAHKRCVVAAPEKFFDYLPGSVNDSLLTFSPECQAVEHK